MTLQHRLVIPMVGSSYAPGDPDPLADTDLWFTDRRGVYHPFIAQRGTGPNAGPDIAADGQRIDPVTGRAEDGQLIIRAIDRRGTIAAIACGANVLIDENGSAGLDASYLSNGWSKHESPTGLNNIHFGNNAFNPYLGGFIIFGAGTFNGFIERTFDGTEDGGAHWTPGQRVGFHYRVAWSLDTGPGNIYAETEGGVDPQTGQAINRVSFPSTAWDFWTIPADLAPAIVFDGYHSAVADANGEVTLRLGGENYGGSCNVFCEFQDLQVVTCEEVVVGVDAERYFTGWLADADARQQLLGLKAYLEESDDGGETWSRVIYVGYVKSIVLAASLTYVITLADSGRGRRTGKAWRNLDPLADFAA